ncbi:AraC-type DNA-binding protein [Clostridium cavendishii DSM 21758]|uniref:AraC-type DNA-binding protein n=1 Tax=Clostridium cavendishii DSM 21758 TaxID=1121302 RepID=A0A1M6GF18_9CLOT|nr:helix-turn-helix domain-containing protein [Clostridium cavendishii]SHJ08517.1 AraC-type DNA-binding protein [Clostridium cavendishii DSM 21758]
MYKREVKFINDDIKINVEFLNIVQDSYHCHRSIELVYIIDGKVEMHKVDHKYVLEKGDFYILNSEDIHKIQNVNGDNIVLIANINEGLVRKLHGGLYGEMFRCRYIKSLVDNDYLCTSEYLEGKKDAVKEVRDYLLRIYIINNLYKKGLKDEVGFEVLNNYKDRINYYYQNLILLILNEFGIVEFFKKYSNLDDETSIRNYKFARYISENYNGKITLDSISEELNLSKYYISRLLNQENFGGLSGYVKDFRAHKGRYVLLMTDKSINEISELVGFSNAGAFIKSFKETFRHTPTEYRKMYKIKDNGNVKFSLEETHINEIIKENIEDYFAFYKSLKYGESLNIDIEELDKLKVTKSIPKLGFALKSDNPVYDSYTLKDRDLLYSINFSNCKIANDIVLDNQNLWYKYGNLLNSIRENENLIESFSMEDLISKSGIETPLYYYYSFLSMLKSKVVQYNNDYLITRDEHGDYAILILLKKCQCSNHKVDIKLNFSKDIYKVVVHKLKENNLQDKIPVNNKEKEVFRRISMPSCSFEIVNNNEYIISAEGGEQYLIEISRKKLL